LCVPCGRTYGRIGSWLCGIARGVFTEKLAGAPSAPSEPLDPVFPISGLSAAQVALSAPEKRFAPGLA